MGKRLELLKEQLLFLKTHNASEVEINEIEKAIIRSKRATKSKAKGGSYEVKIAGKFNKRFPVLEMVKTPSSGGFQKSSSNEDIRGDVSNLNKEVCFLLHIECKNQKKWDLNRWIKQAQGDCPKGKIPCIVFHQQQIIKEGKVTEKSEDYITLKLDDFMKIVKEDEIIKEISKK